MWIVISITFLAFVVAVFPIVFEDALKKTNRNVPRREMFKIALSKVNPFKRWFILSIFLLNALTCVISVNSLNDNKRKQKAIELEKENIFIHFQNEVDNNLQKLLFFYDSVTIMQYVDTSLFIAVKLSDLYIKKYESISKQKYVIGWLTQTSEAIVNVNNHIDHILNTPFTTGQKKIETKYFLESVETAKDYLYPIYDRVYKLKSYKEYESIDFTVETPPVNRDTLNLEILQSVLQRPDVKIIPRKK